MMLDVAGARCTVVLPIVSMPRAAEMRVPLQPHQAVVVRELLARTFSIGSQSAGTATAILDMPPGSGKTLVAAAIAIALRQRTLFVSPRKHLAKQTVDDIASKTTLTVVRVGSGSANASADVCVAVINSVLRMSPQQLAQYSFVVFDEIHMYCSRSRKDVFFNVNARCMLGLSGTPTRRDGFDRLYRWYLGEPLHAMSLPAFNFEAIQFTLHVTFVNYHGPAELTRTRTHSRTGKPFVHYMYEQMLSDERRCRVIVDEIIRLYDAGHNVFVFAEECVHLQKLIEHLRKTAPRVLVAGDAVGPRVGAANGGAVRELREDGMLVGYFVGGVSSAVEEQIRTTARIVFTTYGLSAVGTSWQHMTAMVLATPRKSGIAQLAARIMRFGSDQAVVREIVDIVDARTFLRRQKKERLIAYRECRAVIKNRDEPQRRGRNAVAPGDGGYEVIDASA